MIGKLLGYIYIKNQTCVLFVRIRTKIQNLEKGSPVKKKKKVLLSFHILRSTPEATSLHFLTEPTRDNLGQKVPVRGN